MISIRIYNNLYPFEEEEKTLSDYRLALHRQGKDAYKDHPNDDC